MKYWALFGIAPLFRAAALSAATPVLFGGCTQFPLIILSLIRLLPTAH